MQRMFFVLVFALSTGVPAFASDNVPGTGASKLNSPFAASQVASERWNFIEWKEVKPVDLLNNELVPEPGASMINSPVTAPQATWERWDSSIEWVQVKPGEQFSFELAGVIGNCELTAPSVFRGDTLYRSNVTLVDVSNSGSDGQSIRQWKQDDVEQLVERFFGARLWWGCQLQPNSPKVKWDSGKRFRLEERVYFRRNAPAALAGIANGSREQYLTVTRKNGAWSFIDTVAFGGNAPAGPDEFAALEVEERVQAVRLDGKDIFFFKWIGSRDGISVYMMKNPPGASTLSAAGAY